MQETSTDTQVDFCVSYKGREMSSPYPIMTFRDLTERTFLLLSFNWTNATGLQTVKLIGSLAAQTAVASLLKIYRLFRCCFRIDVKTISVPYLQGSALVGWMPCVNGTEPRDLQSISAYQAMVISAAKQNSITFTIPYISPEDWMDTTSATITTDGEHATIYFIPMNTLLTTNASVPASIPVEIYGTIESMDMSGYQSQMSKDDNWSRVTAYASLNKKEREDAEARAKATSGKDANVGMVVRNLSHIARNIPIIGGVWSPIADVINAIFSTELSKPVSKEANHPMIMPYYNDINQVAGLTDATTISLYQNPRTYVAPIMFGMDTSFKSVAAFVGKPMLFDQVTFNGTTTTWSVVPKPWNLGSTITTGDYLYNMAKCFRFWRGSIKFLFYFCMPEFYSVRIRLRLWQNTTASNVGNIPSMNIDVKGDTWVPVTVPFVNFRTWYDKTSASAVNVTSTLLVEQLSPIVGAGSPSTAVVYVNIFRAGGEDTQFAVPIDPLILPAGIQSARTNLMDMSSYKGQTSINDQFAKMFPTIDGKSKQQMELHMVMAETVDDIGDLMKRPEEYSSVTALGDITAMPTTGMHGIISSSFMFYRGSTIYRHVHKGNTTTHGDGWYLQNSFATTNRIQSGWAPAYQSLQAGSQHEAINIPWYCAAPFRATAGKGGSYISGFHQRVGPMIPFLKLGTPDTICISAGDDFVYMMQVPWANQYISMSDRELSENGGKRIRKNG